MKRPRLLLIWGYFFLWPGFIIDAQAGIPYGQSSKKQVLINNFNRPHQELQKLSTHEGPKATQAAFRVLETLLSSVLVSL